jgi:hypothetical protein
VNVPDFLVGFHHTIGNTVATNNASKDVDKNSFYLFVFKNNSEPSFYRFGICSTSNIEEVGRLTTGEFNDLHGCHSKACTFYHARDGTIKR